MCPTRSAGLLNADREKSLGVSGVSSLACDIAGTPPTTSGESFRIYRLYALFPWRCLLACTERMSGMVHSRCPA
ncbi:hypothetical protein J4Q44_G00330240 [Coregonus suidteri]|uniref:Uncharacterized protein n=1 Tax=Coregonus suidteri TaxID=861788 RepID=A0AAN8KQH7_9TELE